MVRSRAKRTTRRAHLLGVGQVAKHTWLMDWNKTKAFATTPTSNGIYVVVSDGTSPGVPAAEYPAFLKEAFRRTAPDPQPAHWRAAGEGSLHAR